MRARFALLVSTALPLAAIMTAPAAKAGFRHAPSEPKTGYVTAESRYSSATISGPVRISAQGRREVQLPGGTWIECRRSCSETLRQETIDFWYIRTNIDPTGDDGPGYLTYRFRW